MERSGRGTLRGNHSTVSNCQRPVLTARKDGGGGNPCLQPEGGRLATGLECADVWNWKSVGEARRGRSSRGVCRSQPVPDWRKHNEAHADGSTHGSAS